MPRQFAGGLANLNYLIRLDGQPCVLRRPPPGPLPPGANDMAREHRVLSSRLWLRFPQAPRSLLYCVDPDVLGAHFLVMEYRPGLTIGADLPPWLDSRAAGPRLARTLVDLLVQLHGTDPAEVGLDHLGKPEGFLSRAIEGWTRRAEALDGAAPRVAVRELSQWLCAHCPQDAKPTLLHCDFKLDNVVLDPETLRPRAVLDWDMATRGHPLFDLATLLSYWTEPGDPDTVRELRQMPTTAPGFPSRAQVVEAYRRSTGCDLSDLPFHRVLAMFKLGVVFLQLHARFLSGATTEPRYGRFGHIGRSILDFTHDIARGRAS
nr:phosphotransferase family protein [Cupriavidus sp. LEh25]